MVWSATTEHGWGQAAWLASCMVSTVSSVVLTTIVTLFATSVLAGSPVHSSVLAAAILDILSLAALLILILIHLWESNRFVGWSRLQSLTIVLTVMTPSIAASILSIYVLAWTHNDPSHVDMSKHHINKPQLVRVAIAMWVLSLISQICVFTMSLSKTSSSQETIITSSETGVFSVETAGRTRQPGSMAMVTTPSHSISGPTSPGYSVYTASPMTSVRNSMVSFLRPVTSRSRLVPPRKDSFSGKDAMNFPAELPAELVVRQEDGFDTWVVDMPASPVDPTSPSSFLKFPRLDTIPGSRPVSPAHPLDGPFHIDPAPLEDSSSIAPMSPKPWPATRPDSANLSSSSPIQSSSPILPTLFIPHSSPTTSPTSGNNSPTLRDYLPPFAPSGSRRPSNSNDQSHIHPLFRNDSPTPPPTASPGTILTASPWGGQVLSLDSEYARGRRNSAGTTLRPGSARSHSRPGSSKSISAVPSSAVGAGARSPTIPRSYSQGDLKLSSRSSGAWEEYPPMPQPVFLAHSRQSSS